MTEYQDERSRQLATKPVGRLLFQFAAPSIIAMAASSIYNLCDSIFIGQGAGPMAIAGLAITFPLMNISTAFGAMAGVGGAAQTSVRMGMNDQHTALMIFGNVLRLDLTIGLILTTLGLVFLDPILVMFGASDATLPYARDYMQIILAGNILTHTFLGMNDQLRATGHPRRAMTAQLIAVVVNILLDAFFIFGMGWGMRGAALATVLGQLCAWLFEVRFFMNRRNFVHFSRVALKFRMSIVREILAIGLSPFCVNVGGCLVVAVLNRMLLDYGGDDGDTLVGVYGIVNRVSMLLVMMVMGFSQGLQPIVGFNLGARLYDRVIRVVHFAVVCAMTVMTIGYALIYFFPWQLASLFTTDAYMISKCVPVLRLLMCLFPFVGLNLIAAAFFQSTRRAKLAIFISISRQILILVPLMILLPRFYGVDGVWWAHPISDVIAIALSVVLLVCELRRLRSHENAHRRFAPPTAPPA